MAEIDRFFHMPHVGILWGSNSYRELTEPVLDIGHLNLFTLKHLGAKRPGQLVDDATTCRLGI